MQLGRKIRVLVVDDSVVFREVLSKGISSDPIIEVVATANDPFDAREKIIKFDPDVLTCDIEMPRMNGIEFIKRLMPQYPLPIVVVSSVSDAVFNAMKAGAVDFVTKPDVQSVKSVEAFINELIEKIKIASAANVSHWKANNALRRVVNRTDTRDRTCTDTKIKLIAIGASTGGTEAIYNVLKSLPPDIPGIVIVQHMPPVFSRMFADRLNGSTQLRVREARSGDYVEEGLVLIAPGDNHMRIKKVGNRLKTEVFKGEKLNGHCPSVDVLFESVAKVCGSDAIGVILTGMGYDGAKGLLSMRKNGARTICQDEESCVVYGMPKVAYNIGAAEKQVSLDKMAQTIISMLK